MSKDLYVLFYMCYFSIYIILIAAGLGANIELIFIVELTKTQLFFVLQSEEPTCIFVYVCISAQNKDGFKTGFGSQPKRKQKGQTDRQDQVNYRMNNYFRVPWQAVEALLTNHSSLHNQQLTEDVSVSTLKRAQVSTSPSLFKCYSLLSSLF